MRASRSPLLQWCWKLSVSALILGDMLSILFIRIAWIGAAECFLANLAYDSTAEKYNDSSMAHAMSSFSASGHEQVHVDVHVRYGAGFAAIQVTGIHPALVTPVWYVKAGPGQPW